MPGSRKYPWQRVKLHRSYDVADIVELTGKHVETVRGWIRSGRLATIGSGKPYLVSGEVLREFLKPKRTACPPGTFYCMRCKAARSPVPASLIFEPFSSVAGMLKGECVHCGTRVRRRSAKDKLQASMPGFDVHIQARRERLEDTPVLPSDADFPSVSDDHAE